MKNIIQLFKTVVLQLAAFSIITLGFFAYALDFPTSTPAGETPMGTFNAKLDLIIAGLGGGGGTGGGGGSSLFDGLELLNHYYVASVCWGNDKTVEIRTGCDVSGDLFLKTFNQLTSASKYEFFVTGRSGGSALCKNSSGTLQSRKICAPQGIPNLYVYPSCGLAINGLTINTPTDYLCASGEPSTVTGTGPWTWTCQGTYGASDQSVLCSKGIGTPPNAPVAGSTTKNMYSLVRNWSPVTDATRYEFSSDNASWFDVGNVTSYNQTGLSCNNPAAPVNHSGYVRACSLVGCSTGTSLTPTATIDCGPVPAIPSRGVDTATQTSVTWKWQSVSDVTRYEWSTDNVSFSNRGMNLDTTEGRLSCGDTHTSYVRACNTFGCSESRILSESTASCLTGFSHTDNSKVFTVSILGNPDNTICKVQYQQGTGTNWIDIPGANYNCGINLTNQSISLPEGIGYWGGSGKNIRIVNGLGSYIGQMQLRCSARITSTTDTPTIDEDCNGKFNEKNEFYATTDLPVTNLEFNGSYVCSEYNVSGYKLDSVVFGQSAEQKTYTSNLCDVVRESGISNLLRYRIYGASSAIKQGRVPNALFTSQHRATEETLSPTLDVSSVVGTASSLCFKNAVGIYYSKFLSVPKYSWGKCHYASYN